MLAAISMNAFELSQLFVAIAFLFDLVSFQLKHRTFILLCFCGACSLLGAHYALLEQWTPFWMEVLALFRFAISIKFTSKKLKYVFHLLAGAIFFITFSGVVSLLTIIAALFQTEAAFHKRDKILRIYMMLGTLCMIATNAIIYSPAAIALECFFLSSNLLGYYRYYIKKQPDETVVDNSLL